MPADGPDDAVALDGVAMTQAAGRLLTRGIARGDAKRVCRAVTLSESVLAAAHPGTATHTGASANTARALIAEYEMTGRAGALDRAIVLLESAEPDSGQLEDRGADFFALLGHALLRDAERTGLPTTAQRAVAARRKARELTSTVDTAYPGRLADLGAMLAVQFRVSGDLAALEEAIRVQEAAARKLDLEDPAIPGLLSNLGNCLDDLAIRDGGIPVLRRTERVHRDALDAVGTSDPLQPMISANLGVTLLHLHQETGDSEALEESIRLHRDAAAQTPEAHVDYQPRRTNLAVALQTLYEETGEPDVLDEAIGILQQAADHTPRDHANWSKYQHDLTSALMRLAQRTGDLSAIDEAIQTWQEVADGTPDRHPAKPGRLSALATTQYMRFQSDQDNVSPLDAGIGNLRTALRLSPPGHAGRAMLLTNLGALLLSRYEHAGERDALDEAIDISRDATAAASPEHADHGRHLSNLGVALVHRARASDKPSDASEAIEAIRQALEVVGPGDPGRAETLIVMGAACARAVELGDSETLACGLAAFREAASMKIASTGARIRAGRDGGRLAAANSDFDEAFSAFASAVQLIEEAAWAGMRQTDQQRLLGELSGLPMDAAAMAIEAGRPGEAVRLLEQGRGVLLARRLEASGLHAQLMALAPEAAGELAAVQAALDDAERDSGPAVPGRDGAARRSRLARQRNVILAKIRADPRTKNLIGPPPLDELLTVCSRGPVVIVNVSEYRCDALILSAGQVHMIPLPRLTRQAVGDQVQALLEATDAARSGDVDDVLEWAWDCIVEPVLAELGLTRPPPDDQDAHLWWCATGLAAFLPLHAAGPGGSSMQTRYSALDLAVSSYTPSLRMLIQLRERRPSQAEGRSGPLIVAMPQTPGHKDLESATDEAEDIARRCPVHKLLSGPSATRDAVAQAMPEHSWAHYACHGSQDLRDPFRGALHLHDGPLGITQITRLHLPHPVLAYVSACDTSRGGTSIPDEGITLASALQVAGYQHVVATLWQIMGYTATDVAKYFYDQVISIHNGIAEIDGDEVASALRAAVIRARANSPGLPAMFWAPYIHTGP